MMHSSSIPTPINHAVAMTRAERAAADKIRLAKLEPTLARIRAERNADFEARWDQLQAIPEEKRTAQDQRELFEMGIEIIFLAAMYPSNRRKTPRPNP